MKTNHNRALMTAARILLVLVCCWQGLRAADWPQWRGPDRTDRSPDTGLLKDWLASGPPRVWLNRDIGLGYSGFSIVGNRLLTMGVRDRGEQLIAVETDTGREIWATRVGSPYENNWGDGPRSTPTVDGDRIYALGGRGDLLCASLADGRVIWRTSMTDLGGKIQSWGYTESVLADGGRVICTPGGSKGSLAALDRETGRVIWQTRTLTDPAQYASAIVVEHGGQRQYVQLVTRRLFGVHAESGKLLWQTDWEGRTAVIPTPIHSDGFVYATSGYGTGCKLVRLTGSSEPEVLYENKVMKNHHGGVVLVDGYLYGYSDGPGWVCQDFRTGREVWSSEALGKGAIHYADGMLYCLEEDSGTVALVEASPRGWKEHGRFRLDPQSSRRSRSGRVWTHPVVINGRLYLRDQELLFCYDVKAR